MFKKCPSQFLRVHNPKTFSVLEIYILYISTVCVQQTTQRTFDIQNHWRSFSCRSTLTAMSNKVSAFGMKLCLSALKTTLTLLNIHFVYLFTKSIAYVVIALKLIFIIDYFLHFLFSGVHSEMNEPSWRRCVNASSSWNQKTDQFIITSEGNGDKIMWSVTKSSDGINVSEFWANWQKFANKYLLIYRLVSRINCSISQSDAFRCLTRLKAQNTNMFTL